MICSSTYAVHKTDYAADKFCSEMRVFDTRVQWVHPWVQLHQNNLIQVHLHPYPEAGHNNPAAQSRAAGRFSMWDELCDDFGTVQQGEEEGQSQILCKAEKT